MQGSRGTAPYTNVPMGVGGTANYPASPKFSNTGGTANYPAGYDKSGFANEYDGSNVKSSYGKDGLKSGYGHDGLKSGYGNGGGGAYVQPTPVVYGLDGNPLVLRKSHRMRNVIIGSLAVCCCCIAL